MLNTIGAYLGNFSVFMVIWIIGNKFVHGFEFENKSIIMIIGYATMSLAFWLSDILFEV